MVSRRLTLAAALSAAVIAPTAITPVRAAPAGRPMPLIGSAITLLGAHTQDQALKNLAAAGVKVIRPDFLWQRMEPEPGRFDFRAEDRLVAAAARWGIDVVAILAYGNPHYSRLGAAARDAGAGAGLPPFGIGASYLYPPDPEHLPEYRRFAQAAAAHFRGRVTRWEVWNEPNVGWRFWPPHEDAVAYARLLRAASAGIRAGNPKATVSSGGVFFPEVPPGLPEEGGLRYLGKVFDADPGVGDAIDAVAWHPYPYPFVAPEVDIPGNGSVVSTVGQMRGFLDARKARERLWVSELGWPTHQEYGVTAMRQAAYLARGFAGLWAEGAEMLVWYTYADGPFSEHNQEDAFGLFHVDGYAKPSYLALRTFTSVLGECRSLGSRAAALRLGAGERALRFSCPQGDVTMLWTAPETTMSDYGALGETDARRSLSVSVRGDKAVVVTTTGRANQYRVRNGRVAVEISPEPIYLADGFAPDPLRSRVR